MLRKTLIFAAAACVAGDLKGLKGKLTCLGRGGDKSEADADMVLAQGVMGRERAPSLRGGWWESSP